MRNKRARQQHVIAPALVEFQINAALASVSIMDDSGVKRLSEQVIIVMDIHCGRKGNNTAG
jgi:hypothetical protein